MIQQLVCHVLKQTKPRLTKITYRSIRLCGQTIHVFTNNRAVLNTLRTPVVKSGQAIVGRILKHVRYLEGFSNHVVFAWAPVNPIFELGQRVKHLAQRSTDEGRVAQGRVKLSKRTVRNAQERLRRATSQVSTMFGESVRRVDAAWPGNHTRRMYDDLSKRQASILAQLRTGMTPLNGYLHNIKAVETNLCECGEAVESREHFVFRCARWSEQRQILGVWTGEADLATTGHRTWMQCELWSNSPWLLNDLNETPAREGERRGRRLSTATIRKPVPY
jgi:hypothetical protein